MGSIFTSCRTRRTRPTHKTILFNHANTHHTLATPPPPLPLPSQLHGDLLKLLRDGGLLLPPGRMCPHCHAGVLRDSIRNGTTYLRCSMCRSNMSVRYGSIFSHTRLPLDEAVRLLRSFEAGIRKADACKLHNIGEDCARLIYTTIRESMRAFMMKHPIIFPGNEIVEIDECHLSSLQPRVIDPLSGKEIKRKKGPKTWVIGLIGRRTGWVALAIANDHTTDTIRPLIDRHIPDPRTTIVTDKDRSFLYLKKTHDHHLSEKRKVGSGMYVVIDSVLSRLRSTGTFDNHSNCIEGYWQHFRHRISSTKAHNVDLLLYECMFRSYRLPCTTVLQC